MKMIENRFEKWGFSLDRPLVFAGPCSVESEQQVLETAKALQNYDVEILRGGIWKPRTRPNSFEGHGKKALPWLKKAGNAINKPVATEVATAEHVQDALEAGIDYLWIGARTSVNPFAVQNIADALRGVDIPVLIKNPINPDLKLWLGAVERIEGAGITKVAVIHRGFSLYGASKYRNEPLWLIPIELRQERPDLPIINDPSHIAGKRDLIQDVSQQALDLGFDGLMIESHINPNEAWSDAAQQITPQSFHNLTQDLRRRYQYADDSAINEFRNELESIDAQLLKLLNERMNVSEKIGNRKKEKNIAIYQPNQLSIFMDDLKLKAKELNLSEEFIINLFHAIHTASIDRQRKVLNKED